MSRLYGPNHRHLQDRFDTRRLADGVEKRVVATALGEDETRFIATRDMFWLASIDDRGRPTVSYKGGDPGFVRVLDPKTIAFPSYDGNGMYYSMGNILGNANVGLLFVDLEHPHRLRVQGTATIDENDPLLGDFLEAELVVRVQISEVFRNCPRYVHRYRKVRESEYVPREAVETPFAEWKRVDDIQEQLPEKDKGRAEREGPLRTRQEYETMLRERDRDA